MAELASGAVNTLLGVIRNEAQLLGGVRGDVQFIQEEMESMHSFLMHLARTAPPGGEHDEQVRTWMNQVRLLAQDCNNCIGLYLYRGNPDIHLAKGGILRYLFWLRWFLNKMIAQHNAAIKLRKLKERARDVGERRLRYGVEVPAKAAVARGKSPIGRIGAAGLASEAERPSSSAAAHAEAAASAGGDAAEDDDEEDEDDQLAGADRSGRRGAIFQPRTLEENIKWNVERWIKQVSEAKNNEGWSGSVPSIAVLAPDDKETSAVAHAAKDMAMAHSVTSVLVDIPEVHFYRYWLLPEDILYYILRELQLQPENTRSSQQREEVAGEKELDITKRKNAIRSARNTLINDEIAGKIKGMKVDHKISQIKSKLQQIKDGQPQIDREQMKAGQPQNDREQMKDGQPQIDRQQMNNAMVGLLQGQSSIEPLGVLLLALRLLKPDARPPTEGGQESKEGTSSPASYHNIVKEASKKLKAHMEEGVPKPICLDETQYEQILKEMFTTTSKPLQTPEPATTATTITTSSTTTLSKDQIKEMIHQILRELQEDTKSMKKQETDDKPGQNQIPDSLIDVTLKNITRICGKIEKLLQFKGIVDKIKERLKGGRILVILKLDNDFLHNTEQTRYALSLLDQVAGALMLTTEHWKAKQYCNPPREPIDYSHDLVGLYRDIVEDLTSQQMNEDKNYNRQIYCDILEKCENDEFCMKVFAHALHANPKRSSEELSKLNSTLQASPKSPDIIANKMLKFSYRDLPKEYRSCLLYLAIFPRLQSIRRSTLIGRWVAEGLITKEDWPSSVRRANRCFDTLLDRWLVYPDDISATGQVKSCVVGDLVHGFITEVARKQHIVETRLSHHLARHFSIFNDLRLRSSDGIDKFFQRLYESPRVSLLKVLDLETCHYFGEKYQRYLKYICNRMLLLKYLSLRGTNITHLPGEINNLHDLEVLDIRQTNVPDSATVNLLLLKLKRLLAGHIYPGPKNSNTGTICVQIPDKIEKMVNVEVLSNVKARNRQDLKDIGKLWQLRKLGVVINDRESHLRNLLRTISDLHECIRSLSITLSTAEHQGIPSSTESREAISCCLRHHPKLLESLSISGTTQRVHLLQLFSTDSDHSKLVKVTLSRTSLNQENWKVLASLPKLQCVRFRYIACIESVLTFEEDGFKNLKYLLVEGSNLTDIIFEKGAACELEKIVLSFTNIVYISGVDGLPKLEELELDNNRCGRLLSSFDNAKHIAKMTLRGTLLEQADLQILAKKPNIQCLVLLNRSCDVSCSQITFNKDGFPKLNLLIVDCSAITKIVFTSGSVPKLEKIVWSSSTSLSGIDNLPRLKDLEFNGHLVPHELKEAIGRKKNKPSFKHIEPEIQDQAGEQEDDDNDARFSSCCKIKI